VPIAERENDLIYLFAVNVKVRSCNSTRLSTGRANADNARYAKGRRYLKNMMIRDRVDSKRMEMQRLALTKEEQLDKRM
jgi:hypothetical protein